MRLVALPPDAAGKVRAGLQIEPLPGWITYWREPGNNGIPPQITVAPDSGVSLTNISFPVPKHISEGGISDIGYDGPVTLPLEFTETRPGSATALKVTAFIGLCKQICIPFQAELSLKLPEAAQSMPEEEAILQAAAASLPASPAPDFKVLAHSLSADGKHLSLKLALPQHGAAKPDVFVSGPSGYLFWAQKDVKLDAGVYEADIAIGKLPKNYDPKGKTWGLLVVDGSRSMETTLAFD